MAESGNESMLRLLLDRLLPAKPRDNPIDTPMTFEGSAAEQARKILDSIGHGELTPEQGKNLSTALDTYINIAAFDELKQRIKKLEEINNANKK